MHSSTELTLKFALKDLDQAIYTSEKTLDLLVRQPLSKRGPRAIGIPAGGIMSDYEVSHLLFMWEGMGFDRIQQAMDARREAGGEGEITIMWGDRPMNEPARKKSYKALVNKSRR